MGGVMIQLRVSALVESGTEEFDYYVPANGEVVQILQFVGEGAYSTNSVTRLVWDLDGPNEECLWTIKGSGVMPESIEVTGDGVKKLAVTIENAEQGSLYMSAYAKAKVIS